MRDREVIKELKRRFSWEIKKRQFKKIADKIGVNRGDIYGVLNGRWKSNKVRVALGLSRITIKVAPCPCGGVHDHQCEKGKGILQRAKSSNPQVLKFVQETIVPFLLEKMK